MCRGEKIKQEILTIVPINFAEVDKLDIDKLIANNVELCETINCYLDEVLIYDLLQDMARGYQEMAEVNIILAEESIIMDCML